MGVGLAGQAAKSVRQQIEPVDDTLKGVAWDALAFEPLPDRPSDAVTPSPSATPSLSPAPQP
ncbi:hypothetical protein ABZT03_39085 [Streptomyces sp. NPDC005574]|uniref:hypothetical protein n=1 Tax=Streptomyces sp. NPDC005574 TaxID=3156891 RepID=UPI0033BD6D25